MLDEQPNGSMEIKTTPVDPTSEDEVLFENPYVRDYNTVDDQRIEPIPEPPMPDPVILYRSKEGIQRWLDEEKVGSLLARTKNLPYDNTFREKYADEIKEYYEKQPEGKEVKTVFEIIEPGDSVNHQTVTEVNENGLKLDYFGTPSTLTNENEIFSILIKEEIEEWKKGIKEIGTENLFAKDDDDMVSLYRTLELMCMAVDMESCEGLYPASSDELTERLVAVMSMSLKKPIYLDNSNKRVVAISADYSNKDANKSNNIVLYNVSLTNNENIEVKEGDRVIL